MQGVGVVGEAGLQAGVAHPGPEAGLGVDADVAALHEGGVVLVGQRPADLLGQPRRHGGGEGAAGLEHPEDLVERDLVVADVLEHLAGDDAVEGVRRERQAEGVAVGGGGHGAGLGAGLAGLAHGAEQAADVLELGRGVVEGDDAGALAERLEGVSSGAAAHVEQQVARLHAEPVEPDGQHYFAFQLQADAVLLDGLHGRVLPRPVVDDALAAAGADGVAQVGLVEGPPELGGQRLAVAGLDEHRGVAVLADDLGDGPAGGGDDRRAAATWPRWPAARSPRRATAPRPAGPRSRAR